MDARKALIELITKALLECTDESLLDLIYKLLTVKL